MFSPFLADQTVGKPSFFCYDKICTRKPVKRRYQMIPAKEEVRRLLDQLPDDTTLDDIQYHI
jgi:hypothetical protein